METLTGTIDRIVYQTEESSFKIFYLKQKTGKKISVKGDFQTLLEGTMIKVHGEYHTHDKYGLSFKAVSCTYTFDDNSRSISLYIQSIAKWVGPERSRDIANKFGSDLERIIHEEPNRLTEIEGIGQKVAQSLVDAWIDNRDMASIKIFLHSLNLPENKIKRIIRKYGTETESVLSENPYLLSFEGFTFSTCDFIASKLGLDIDSPLRYRYFILYTLKQCLYNGHLYLSQEDVYQAFVAFNANSEIPFCSGKAIEVKVVKEHLKSLEEDAFIIKDGNFYYEMESFFFENESARKLSLIHSEKDKSSLKSADPKEYVKRYQEEQSYGGRSFEFSSKQKEAVESFIREKILVVTGTPGTGKTTVIKSFVQLMKEKNVSFELLTPTGISAKKLGDTAGEEAMTIHRRLGYKGSDWDYNSTNKYSTDVIIVDEVSMVDMEVFYRLVSAVHNTTRFVFVGDNNQLPSVGPGNVLSELISCGMIKLIHLDKIFRQEECSDIILAAERIKNGDTDLDLFSRDKNRDIWHIAEKNPGKIEDLVKKFSSQLKEKKKVNFQIFSPRNQGPLSVDTLNVALQESLNPADPMKKEVQLNRSIIRKGDRIIITKNNYNLAVFNGDIGKVVYITADEVCVDIDEAGGKSKRISIPMDIADDHLKLAYAITVHKCLHPENRIFTEEGYKALRDVKVGDRVMTREGYGIIKWAGYTGEKEIYEVTTRSGLKTLTSKDHKMLICDERGERYLETSKIIRGMYSVTPKSTPFDNAITSITIPEIHNCHKRKEINIPANFDKDLAWLTGALIGDGCYTDQKDGLVSFTSPTSPELLEEVQRIVSSYGISVCNHYKKEILYSKYFISRTFRDWMLSIGMGYHHSGLKFIPNIFFKINVECRRELIAGLFDTDGCIDERAQARFTTSSEKLADDLQLLLRTIGVISFKSKQGDKHYKVIVSGSDLEILKSQITLRDIKKRAKILCTKPSRKSNHYVIPNGKILIESFKRSIKAVFGDTQGKKGLGLNSLDRKLSIKINNILIGKNMLRRDALAHLIKFSDDHGIVLNSDVKKASDENIYYDEIVSIRKLDGDKIDMIDLEVDGDPSFITDGMFCHNSQGQEYPLVIMPFIKAHGAMLLQRNLLYTAITRAKKKVIIIGELSAVERAIMNDSIQKRNTLFAKRISAWFTGEGKTIREMYSNSDNYLNVKNLQAFMNREE